MAQPIHNCKRLSRSNRSPIYTIACRKKAVSRVSVAVGVSFTCQAIPNILQSIYPSNSLSPPTSASQAFTFSYIRLRLPKSAIHSFLYSLKALSFSTIPSRSHSSIRLRLHSYTHLRLFLTYIRLRLLEHIHALRPKNYLHITSDPVSPVWSYGLYCIIVLTDMCKFYTKLCSFYTNPLALNAIYPIGPYRVHRVRNAIIP